MFMPAFSQMEQNTHMFSTIELYVLSQYRAGQIINIVRTLTFVGCKHVKHPSLTFSSQLIKITKQVQTCKIVHDF
jgi:hypothetical protein